ncbi:MAG: glycerol-3-phosphate responsive antiterminator [Lachnospiraceae bacterium]|nr:glycerol-3-phosphate responsive antiterminator [Lachnospiraceae bacterium]
MSSDFYKLLENNPVIAAIKDEKGLKACCQNQDIRVIFVLYGNICNIVQIVEQLKREGKTVLVHVDLIEGLNGKEIVVDFIRSHTMADGIISTKPALIRKAGECGLCTILRVFVLDSISLKNVSRQAAVAGPDMLEMLPGVMPKIIRKVKQTVRVPVIAGGLISDKEDVIEALSAGAISVSTTNPAVWEM